MGILCQAFYSSDQGFYFVSGASELDLADLRVGSPNSAANLYRFIEPKDLSDCLSQSHSSGYVWRTATSFACFLLALPLLHFAC